MEGITWAVGMVTWGLMGWNEEPLLELQKSRERKNERDTLVTILKIQSSSELSKIIKKPGPFPLNTSS